MPRVRAWLLCLALLPTLGGCAYLRFLPLLKPPVDTSPQGRIATRRGPAFGADSAARAEPDPRVDWMAYNRSLDSRRFSPLDQITAANVGSLGPVCTFGTGERTPMQSGPVVVDGTMYLTTAVNTYAVDAATCRLRWRHTYDYHPKPDFDLRTNRGVAYLNTPDGPRLFRGANDGRVYAIDARTGRQLWNVLQGDVELGETFPAAPIAWRGRVYIGNAGGDNFGVIGRMMALDARTGAQLWMQELVAASAEPNLTWPPATDRVPKAGGATWTSYTLDPERGLLYVPTGNAAPDFLAELHPGTNDYTYSVVVLEAATGAFRAVYRILPEDEHDWDVAAAPALVTTAAGREMVAVAGKDGHLHGVERDGGRIRYRTPITSIFNADADLTPEGTRFCPGVQGGAEWNGAAYSPDTNLLYVGAVDWCTTVHTVDPAELRGKRGIPWTGSASLFHPFGTMDPVENRRGWLTALDADDGTVRWRYAAPGPMVAATTATAGGVVFAADLSGDVLAFDARTGEVRFRWNTGQPIGGGVVTYAVNGRQYVAVASGLHSPLAWKTRSTPAKVVVFALPDSPSPHVAP